LIVVYGEGYTGPVDRPLTENGRRQFAVGVPNNWTKQQLLDFLLQTEHETSFPKWEAPTRGYGLNMLKWVSATGSPHGTTPRPANEPCT
jgi:hypothetical protein